MIYATLLDKILFPLSNALMGRNFWKIHKQLLLTQWMSRKELEAMQLQKLKQLVKHAYETVPMYKELMQQHKVTPEDIQTLADIKKLPIVNKDNFRRNFPDRCTSMAVPKKQWMYDSTSGSTGKPFQFIRDRQFSDHALANTYRQYTWTGISVGEKVASLWGYHTSSFGVKMLDSMLRRRFYSSFDVENNFAAYYRDMKRYKPSLIEAYSASVTHYAKLLKEHKLTGLHIKSAISSAETLYPENRKIIEQTLHARVYNRYGSREVGNVAQECHDCNKMHINSECYIVEIVKDNPKEKKGRLVVTNLTNYTMPFIRYDTEDYGVMAEKHSCTRGLHALDSIEGRVTDFIKLPNGKELSFLFFNYYFEQYGKYIKQFQVVQDKKNHLALNLVVTDAYNPEKEKIMLAGLKKKTGMNITVLKVNKIETEPSGKLRPVKRTI